MVDSNDEILARIDERVAKLASDMSIICAFRQDVEHRLSSCEASIDSLESLTDRVCKLEERVSYVLFILFFIFFLVLGRYIPLNIP